MNTVEMNILFWHKEIECYNTLKSRAILIKAAMLFTVLMLDNLQYL